MVSVLKDSKAVTPVIGFILLLQILIILLAFIQTTIVPDQLKKIEADNVKSVKSEMVKFSALASTGSDAYLLVKTPEYPHYLFLLTPEPAGFSIWTEPMEVNVSMTLNLPNGSKMNIKETFQSKRLFVRVDNYFYPDTTFVYENTAVFQKNDGRFGLAGDQKMIKNGLNLVIIRSNLSQAYNSPKEFSFKAISSGGRHYAENITVEFDSVNPDYWKRAGFSVSGNTVTASTNGTVSMTVISDVEKRLQPKYMIKMNSFDSYSLSVGDSQELSVLVTDRYLNPVSGIKINVSVSGSIGEVTPYSVETDSSGVARISFKATSPGNGEVTFSSGSLIARYNITVIQPQSGNRSSLVQVNWLNNSGTWDAGIEGGRKILAVKVTDSQSTPIPGIEVRFSVTNTSVLSLNATTALTNSDGVARVEASALANGSVKVYAFAGDGGDVLSINVVNLTASFWAYPSWGYRIPIYIQERSGNNLPGFQVLIQLDSSFNWSAVNLDGSDIRFADVSGNAIDYWIEEWNYGTSAKIWVKVNLSANENKTIYMYYGNPTANSQSDGNKVFIFFDDFNTDTSSNYKIIENWITGSPTFIWNPSGSEITTDTSNADFFLVVNSNLNLPGRLAVEIKAYTGDDDSIGALLSTTNGEYYIAVMRVSDYDSTNIRGPDETLIKFNSVPIWYSEATLLKSFGNIVNPSSWQVGGIAYDGSRMYGIYNHVVAGSYTIGNIPVNKIGLSTHANNPRAHYDWILVRNFIDPEPSVTIGTENRR